MQCDCTSSKGLTILPVNYCVIPKIEGLTLPIWANHASISKVKLKYDYNYALRVVREGFLYIFYEEGSRGNNYWEVYRIAENGTFWKQISVQMATDEDSCGCAAVLQNTASAEFICIEKPKQCGKVWLAYSEHRWKDDVFKNYKENIKLRSERMSVIEPKKMANGSISEGNGVAQLKESNLKQIIDYSGIDIKSKMADPTIKYVEKLVSDNINEWNGKFLDNHGTAVSWKSDRNLNNTIKSASGRSTEKSGYIISLMDAVGIAHELNGWCNEIVGHLDLFGKERKHEIQSDAFLTVFEEGFIQSLEDEQRGNLAIHRAIHRVDNYWLENVTKTEGEGWLTKRRKQYQIKYIHKPEMLAALNQGCDLFDFWMKYREIGSNYYQRLDSTMTKLQNDNDINTYLKKIFKLRKNSEMTVAIDKLEQKTEDENVRKIPRQQFEKYKARINQPLRETYKQKYKEIEKRASLLHEKRSENVFIWLQSENYLNVLNDYSQNNLEDGIEFERIVVCALNGIQETKIGNDIIGEWIKSYKIPKTNIVWRAVTFNQQTAIDELEAFFSEAMQYSETDQQGRFQRAILNTSDNLKSFTEISKEINETLEKGKPKVNASLDKKFAYKRDQLADILITKFFRTTHINVVIDKVNIGADNINHFIAQTTFMARAGLEPGVIKEVNKEYYIRRDWVERMKKLDLEYQMSSAPFPKVKKGGLKGALINSYLKTYTHNMLRKIIVNSATISDDVLINRKNTELWKIYNDQNFAYSLKGSRLSAVLLVFQIPVIYSLFAFKNDYTQEEYTYLVLSAAGGLINSITEVLIKPSEIAFGKISLVTGLRLTGQFAAGASAIFGLLYAIPQINKKNQDKVEEILNYANVIVYFSQIMKLSYSLIEMSPKLVKKLTSKLFSRLFMRFISLKIFSFFASWWVQLILLAVDFVWNLIVDDDIQKWIRTTRFGTQYDKKISPNFEAELQAFKELMKIKENQEKVDNEADSFLTYIGWDNTFLSDFSFNDILGLNTDKDELSQINIPYRIN